MKLINKTGHPPIPAAKDKPEAEPIEVALHTDAVASIRRGLAQAGKGEGRLATDVLDELEREIT